MPAKHTIKQYHAEQYYHVFNRGVEKRKIFYRKEDYFVFLSYMKTYLLPKNEDALYGILSSSQATYAEKNEARRLLLLNNYYGKIRLHGYCLMPNHFHLFLYQSENEAIDGFMNSLGTRYSMYINSHYRRVGHLLQDVYKAVSIESNEQLLALSRYIHRNPLSLFRAKNDIIIWNYQKFTSKIQALRAYPYSSYRYYQGKMNAQWIDTTMVLSQFSSLESYCSFVENAEDSALFETEKTVALEG